MKIENNNIIHPIDEFIVNKNQKKKDIKGSEKAGGSKANFSVKKNDNQEVIFKRRFKKYPRLKVFFEYLVSYYRLIVMLDEEKQALFEEDELSTIIEILVTKNVFPSLHRVFAYIIAKFCIQDYDVPKEMRNNNDNLLFIIKEKDIEALKNKDSDLNNNRNPELKLRKIENITLCLIQSTYNSYQNFPNAFNRNIKSYLTYFNNSCISPTVFCCFKANLFREKANYQNRYAFYSIVLSYLIAFKFFLENLIAYQYDIKEQAAKMLNNANIINEIKSLKNKILKSNKKNTIQNFKKSQINNLNLNNIKKEEISNISITDLGIIPSLQLKSDVFSLIEEYGYYNFKENELPLILNYLEQDISDMQSDKYDSFNITKIIETFKYYLKYINLANVCSPFEDNKKEYTNINLQDILNYYTQNKSKYEEMVINNFSKKGDPKNKLVKLELLSICEKVVNKVESQLDINRYLYFLFKTKRKLFKIDKELFQAHTLKTHAILDIHTNLLHYLNRIFNEKIMKQFISVLGINESFEYRIFVTITEFYSYLCLNENLNGQMFLAFMELPLNNNIDANKTSEGFKYPNSNTNGTSNINVINLNKKEAVRETPFISFFLKKSLQILKCLNYYNSKSHTIAFLETQPKNEYFKILYSSIITLFRKILSCSHPNLYLNAFRISAFTSWFNYNFTIINKINKNIAFCFYMSEFMKFCTGVVDDYPNILKEHYQLFYLKTSNHQAPIKQILKVTKPFIFVNILKTLFKRTINDYEYELKQKQINNLEIEKDNKKNQTLCLSKVNSSNNTKLKNNSSSNSRNNAIEENAKSGEIEFSAANFLQMYKTNHPIMQDDKFKLCLNLYFYLYTLMCKADYIFKIQKILDTLNSTNEEFLFFSYIVKSVEIAYKITDSIDQDIIDHINHISSHKKLSKVFEYVSSTLRNNQTHVEKHAFIIIPEILFLTNKDFGLLYKEIKLENASEKNNSFIDLIPKLKPLANIRRRLLKKSSAVVKQLISFNYKNEYLVTRIALNLTAIFSIVINLILLFKDLTLSQYNDSDSKGILDSLYWINLAHLISLSFFIINWFFFGFIYKIHIDEYSYINGKISIYANFCFCLAALFYYKLTFLYSFCLLSCVSLFSTMQMVIKAVQSKWLTFLNTGALILIIMWIFSGIGFYYQNGDFYDEDLLSNLCDTYFHCSLSIFNYYLRDGYFDENILSVTDKYYYKRFFYEWFFFLIINLILLNAINGIIVDTFQNFREEDNAQNNQINNVCYICSLDRGELEMFGINFNHHIFNDHNTYYYVKLLVCLNYKKKYQMSFVDFYVYELFDQDLCAFLPYKESKALNGLKGFDKIE